MSLVTPTKEKFLIFFKMELDLEKDVQKRFIIKNGLCKWFCLVTFVKCLIIHHLKALSLSNVHCLFLSIFIKGIHRNLCLKSSGFCEHFHSKGQVPLKNVGLTLNEVPNSLKFVSSVRRRAVFCRT